MLPISLPRINFVICVALPFLVLGVFWPATRNGFVNYDDPTYVLNNPWVRMGPTPASVRWAFQAGTAANWHPVTWISHMIDCRLYGLQPWGHHLTSILLHATNTVLVYLTLRKLTGATWRSLCVALLFGVHPLRVESVAWVAERKDVLSTFFWLATIWAYAMWVEVEAAGLQGARRYRFLAFLCLGLGLMSKPMLVTLPCVLLLLDYWPLRRFQRGVGVRNLFLEKLPFFGLAIAACVVTWVVQREAGAFRGAESFPLSVRIGNAVLSCSEYLANFFLPIHLAIFYPHPGWALPWQAVFLSALLLSGITGIALWQWRKQPWLIVGWLWYLGTLVPVIGLVQVGTQAMADRYTYVPMLGFVIALVWSAHELAQRWRIPAPVLVLGMTTAVGACVVLTRIQIAYWQDSETLFRHALAVTTHNAVAHGNLAAALVEKGKKEEAIGELDVALQIDPDSSVSQLSLGNLLDSVGRTGEAVPHLLAATHLEPDWPQAAFSLAGALDRQGRTEESIAAYQRTLELKPDFIDARLKLGMIYVGLHRYDEALNQFQELLRLRPGSADACINVGGVLFAQRRLNEALPYYEKALQLEPGRADASRNLEALKAAIAGQSQR